MAKKNPATKSSFSAIKGLIEEEMKRRGNTPNLSVAPEPFEAKDYGDAPLPNAPMPANIPTVGRINVGPNPDAEAAAIQYAKQSGVPYTPVTEMTQVDPEFATKVAREYQLMEHNPSDYRVKESYNQLIDELGGQYEAMLSAGIKPEFDLNPYPQSPYLSLLDMIENKRLKVYPTREGFGSNADFDPSQNPLLAESPFKISGQPATYNDLFRAVHDFQGHGKIGSGFRAMGEENAYRSHAGTFSPLAAKALATETRGQNSWLNYGPYGERNRTAGIEDTVFADQKTGLLPNWAVMQGLPEADARRRRTFDLIRAGKSDLSGALDEAGNLTLIHRSKKPLDRVDPKFDGTGYDAFKRDFINNRANEDYVKRSYYGIDADVDPYKPEYGVGNIEHEVKIPVEQIYDARSDPDNIFKGPTPRAREHNIWKNGYSGYYSNDPRLGKVAVVFDPLDVTKKLAVVLSTGAVISDYVEEQEGKKGLLGSFDG
jgi:hypothetical protein